MGNNIGKTFVKVSAKMGTLHTIPVATAVAPIIRLHSSGVGLGSAKVKKVQVKRHHRIAEILSKVSHRNGTSRLPSHVDHLVGKVSDSDLPSLDLEDKTEMILRSSHPVRFVLERELFNNMKHHVKYYDWLTLFGRGIRTTDNPKYDEMVNFISRGADSGMFSSEIHQTIVDIPEDYQPTRVLSEYSLGNKYAVLVGDYFAIRCIYFVEKAKDPKSLLAISKGLEEYTTASFAVNFMDSKTIYPHLPHSSANLDAWVKYNHKASGYFTGGLYALLVVNYKGLPKDERLLDVMKKFTGNLAVLIKAVQDIETFEALQEFPSVPTSINTTLPAILHFQRHPNFLQDLRNKQLNFQQDFKEIVDEIERGNAIQEAKYIVKELAHATKKNLEEMGMDSFYRNVISDLIDTVSSFD